MSDKQQKAIAFKVSDELYESISERAANLHLTVSGFIKAAINRFINPPDPIIQEKIIEVEKIVEKEVIKEILIDSEGTVQGHVISLSDSLFAELSRIKYNPDTTMDAFVADICWNRIQWAQKKKAPSGIKEPPAGTESKENAVNVSAFEEFRQMKKDCETDDDWKELIVEITEATALTEKQKHLLINTTFK